MFLDFKRLILNLSQTKKKKNKKVLILGAGGVAPSIILALQKSNILNISLSNRTYEKSLFLKKKFKEINLLKWDDFSQKLKDFDIIINATSIGLGQSVEFENDFSKFKKNMVYIDTIYNPAQTKMIKYFKSNQVRTHNGLNMLIYQGQKAFYLWTKVNPEIDQKLIELLLSKLK